MTDTAPRVKIDRPFVDEAEIRQLVEQFVACTWPYERWTHRAHLAVGLCYALELPYDEALARLRAQINLYNRTCGDPQGYHETITVLFLRRLYAEVRDRVAPPPLAQWVDELTQTCSSAWVQRYYSKALLGSPTAKSSFVPPDVQPLDF